MKKNAKYANIDTNESTHSEIDPVWQNPIEKTNNCSSKCAYDCTASVHNTIQNSSDNLTSYLQTV